MVTRLSRDENSQDSPYMRYSRLSDRDEQEASGPAQRVALGLRGVALGEEESACFDREQPEGDDAGLVSPDGARARSHSTGVRLKNRLKQMKAGFSSEKSGIADAFIESTKNKPQYMKEEHSHDLLV